MVDQNFTEYTDCASFPEEPWRCNVILIVQRVLGALSFLGCSLVIFMIWLFRRYRRSCPQRLILYIAISGGVDSLSTMLAFSENESYCKILGFLSNFTGWAMLLWALGIAVQLFLATYHHSYSRRYEWAYHYIVWPWCLVISLLPFFDNKYGDSGVWCWIVNDTGWRMGTWYVPLMVILAVMFVLYISIIVKLRKLINNWQRTYSPEVEANKQFLKEEVRPLLLYPCIYFLLYIIPTVNRVQNALSPDRHIFALVLLAAMSVSMLGAANSLFYGLDQDTRKKLTKAQIITAWYSHFTPEAKIGEYNTDSPVQDVLPSSNENMSSSPAVIETTSSFCHVDAIFTIEDSDFLNSTAPPSFHLSAPIDTAV